MTRSHLTRLLAAATIAAGVSSADPATSHAASCANAGRSMSQLSLAQARRSTLCLLNVERRKRGLRPLAPSLRLRHAAERHSTSMVTRRYFAHGNFVGRIRAAGYLAHAGFWRVGENIAWGGGSTSSPGAVMRMWMHSPPHRHNILSTGYRHVGIGIARGTPVGIAGGTYTTDFGARS